MGLAGSEALRFVPSGDRGLLVHFDFAGAQGVLHACAERLLSGPPEGLVAVHPGYGSLLLEFDPLRSSHVAAEAAVRETLDTAARQERPPRTVEIPVCYEGSHAPDLDEVAALVRLTRDDVVRRHAAAVYRVEFLGFVPGFAYLSGLPESLTVPRRTDPRRRVPAGSVAISGGQAAVYPFATPGGWHLLGRTPVRMFDPGREPMARLAPGDTVRFVPIPALRFDEAFP